MFWSESYAKGEIILVIKWY